MLSALSLTTTHRIRLFGLKSFKNILIKSSSATQFLHPNMSISATAPIDSSDDYLERARRCVPVLSNELHKGQAGRIGVIGGSFEYTGAPYFAALSALKCGADIVHVFCCKDAAIPIKSYSPELMVHPVLDDQLQDPVKLIEPWLDRLHVLVIGPGLGRDPHILATITKLLHLCKQQQKPLVIDADALFLLSQDLSVIANYAGVILTPNVVEFERLFGDDDAGLNARFEQLGPHVTVLKKGFNDFIYSSSDKSTDYLQVTGGGGRRCGGQGDILAGSIAVFFSWALRAGDPDAAKVACYGASYFLKKLNPLAFAAKGRSMTASDMIDYIHVTFERYFEHKKR